MFGEIIIFLRDFGTFSICEMMNIPEIQCSFGDLMLDEMVDRYGALVTRDCMLTTTGDFIALKNSDNTVR